MVQRRTFLAQIHDSVDPAAEFAIDSLEVILFVSEESHPAGNNIDLIIMLTEEPVCLLERILRPDIIRIKKRDKLPLDKLDAFVSGDADTAVFF